MEDAWKIENGRKIFVRADDIKRQYGGCSPRDLTFICRSCGQPLVLCALAAGSKQSPHFRHKSNNTRAKRCELYAQQTKSCTEYQKVHMPLFIRQSRDNSANFIVEAGFRRLPSSQLSTLEQDGAEVVIGQKRYEVTSQRFSKGMVKLPIDEVPQSWGMSIHLERTALSLDSTWGCIEDATENLLVFAVDEESKQGRRVEIGNSVVIGSSLYLLASLEEEESIKISFPFSEKLGTVGHRGNYGVFSACVSDKEADLDKARSYLKLFGISVVLEDDTPVLLWPPALSNSGELVPLFKRAVCIFEAPFSPLLANKLHIHSCSEILGKVETAPLCVSENPKYGIGIVRNEADLSYISSDEHLASMAILLHAASDVVSELYKDEYEKPCLLSIDDGNATVFWLSSGFIKRLSAYKHEVETVKPNCENEAASIGLLPGDTLRVCKPLCASKNQYLILAEYRIDERLSSDCSNGNRLCPRECLIACRASKGQQLARNRASKKHNNRSVSSGKMKATIRGGIR